MDCGGSPGNSRRLRERTENNSYNCTIFGKNPMAFPVLLSKRGFKRLLDIL